MNPKRVLIVEDQADIRELIRMTLEFENFEIEEAVNGVAGLAAVRQFKPQLVLLDVMMPGGLDGFGVCEQLRADATTKRTRVVMLTARGSADDRSRGQSAGADAFLVKPFSPGQLLKTVQRLI